MRPDVWAFWDDKRLCHACPTCDILICDLAAVAVAVMASRAFLISQRCAYSFQTPDKYINAEYTIHCIKEILTNI